MNYNHGKSQKEICYMMLQDQDRWFPVHEFIGEKMLGGSWYFLSHKGTARISDVFLEGDDVERQEVVGKSGAQYYEYRLKKVQNTLFS